MGIKLSTPIIVLATCLVAFYLESPSAQTEKSACHVAIAEPRSGSRVGSSVLVRGTARVPRDATFWTFARRQGLALVWPQGGGPTEIDGSGEFSVLVTLGEPRDVGAEFEILSIVVSQSDSTRLEAWVRQAEATGRYPGIRLPPFAVGCGPPATVRVVKTS